MAAVALVGNILEMLLEKYDELPLTNEEKVKWCGKTTHCQMLVNAVIKLADD